MIRTEGVTQPRYLLKSRDNSDRPAIGSEGKREETIRKKEYEWKLSSN